MGALPPRDVLALFVERTDQLLNLPLIRSSALKTSFSFNFNSNTGVRALLSQPDEESFRSYMLTFRRFVAHGDSLYLGKIHSFCFRLLTSDKMKGDLQSARDIWKQECKRGLFKMVVNGREMTPEHIADCWINGIYFHDDLGKKAELERGGNLGFMLNRSRLIDFVIETTKVLICTRNIVRASLTDGLFDFSAIK